MTDTLSEQKQQLRQVYRQIRKGFGEDQRTAASRAICERLENWDIFQQAEVILTYLPIKGEVDLTPLLERYPLKRWALPRIIPEENHRMVFHPYDPARLIQHAFGMAEPDSASPIIESEEIQLVIAPGLAFDRSGWRLGYGGGYFDRFLSKFTGRSIGAVYQALLVEQIPHSEYDVPVQWLVTENEFFPAIR